MRFALITIAAIAAGTIIGCKDEPKVSPATTPASTQPSMADKMKDDAAAAAAKAKDEAAKAGENMKEGADKAGEKIKEGADKTGEKIKEGAEKAKEGAANLLDKAKEGASKAGSEVKETTREATEAKDKGVMAKMEEEAKKYYDQAMEAVKKKDFTAADKAVENLEKIKGQLSPEWASKIDTLKATVEQAKKAGAVKIPGVTE